MGAYATVVGLCVASVAVGWAILALCGRREFTLLAGPVGFAALLTAVAVAIRLPGHAATAAAVMVGLVAASAVALVASGMLRSAGGPARAAMPALAAAAIALLAASIPFIAAGQIGILGVGLVNDDMASHLLISSWLDERFTPEPVFIDQGYPWGPHALVAGLAALLGTDHVLAFAGLTMAVPVLTALVAYGALTGLRPATRIGVAALVALPYMATAYLAQEAFKEPILALLLLGFALLLPGAAGARSALPLGVLAAGVVYTYSFPGLAWLAGAALAWLVARAIAGRAGLRWPEATPMPSRRAALAALAGGVAALLVLTAPDWGRIADFTDFRALDPDRANEGGLGNLRGHISPLEALGVWPTSEFRLPAGAGSLPAAAFYAGALLGAAGLALGLPAWLRRHGPAIPAALVTAAVIYVGARAFGTVYTSAKALAIAAPLIMLIALGGLVGGGDRARLRRLRAGVAICLAAGAALSSFLILRQAPVGPTAHMDELARIRPLVEGENVLFLGRDNFVLYELRGSKPFTHVRNFYDPYFVKPNFELEEVGSKFDFDAVTARKLERFPYVLTTRAGYASGPPPGYAAAEVTDSYVLWRAGGPVAGRAPVESGPQPSGLLRCGRDEPVGRAAVLPQRPVVGPESQWSPAATVENGGPATITVEVPRGSWDVSLRYDSTRALELRGPGMSVSLPGNLDYRGVAPYWAAGRIDVARHGPVTFTATVAPPPLAGRLLGAGSIAHLGDLALSPASGSSIVPARQACGGEADWVYWP
jgi:hypothetical protein